MFAPSILFFALNGDRQTFRWQENGAAGALTPVLLQMVKRERRIYWALLAFRTILPPGLLFV